MRFSDLNYQHLLYFRTVAREGSVSQAARVLNLAPPTISGQVKLLEERLGAPLFRRAGRALVLTSFGEEVFAHAESIFSRGEDLVRMVNQGPSRRRLVRVGVSAVLPKLLARQHLLPATRMGDAVELVIRQGPADALLGQLAARQLDVVLSDAPLPTWMAVRARSHLLEDTGIAVFGVEALAVRARVDLPTSLGNVPWLVPGRDTALRHGLEAWWESIGIAPQIAAEVEDSALLKALGEIGVGVFAAPASRIDEIVESYHVVCIGRSEAVHERCYAIALDETPQDPAVRALCGLPPE